MSVPFKYSREFNPTNSNVAVTFDIAFRPAHAVQDILFQVSHALSQSTTSSGSGDNGEVDADGRTVRWLILRVPTADEETGEDLSTLLVIY